MKKLLLTTLLILVFISTQVVAKNANSVLAVIDAGSTGSRIHVYSYTPAKDAHTLPQLKELYQEKVKPGLSSYAETPNKAGTKLQGLLDKAKLAIQANNIDATGIKLYLFATGGMRLLPAQQQQAIYDSVRDKLKNPSFNLQATKTIPGWQEGVFAWIAANYLHHPTKLNWQYGLVELGGASSQITFPTEQLGNNIYSFQLADNKYQVFAYSFPHLGTNQSFEQLSNYGDIAMCYPQNYAYRTKTGETLGNYNYTECKQETTDEVTHAMTNINIPTIPNDMRFFAVSAFYYTFDFFNAKSNLTTLKNNVIAMCNNQNWQEIKVNHQKTPEKYLVKYCFTGTYILSLLDRNSGYGIGPEKNSLVVTNKINGVEPAWSLGVALYLIAGSGISVV